MPGAPAREAACAVSSLGGVPEFAWHDRGSTSLEDDTVCLWSTDLPSLLADLRFYAETGIKNTDWLGKYWARWGDALKEAGLTLNTLQVAYGAEHLLELLAAFARELGRVPGRTDLQLKAHRDRGFPAVTTFNGSARSMT
jgi:hypothetical protein